MIRTRICDLLGIEHPVLLGGMASGTGAELVAAVSRAGGFGTLGVSTLSGEQIEKAVDLIRELTDRPFGVNFLLFYTDDARFDAALRVKPNVVSTAWPWSDQDLSSYFARAHDAGPVFW
jgi:NAD(P)H-dependent flavin oxidoreductase YrpB (nitropropane dioxygenase family)